MDDILIYRESEIRVKTTDIKVGDKIPIELSGIGSFTATAHKVTDDEVLFIMDEYIALKPMVGLQEWLDTVVYNAFPDELKKRIKNITIPSVGQVFGWDDKWCKEVFEPDSDKQLPLMKQRRYRIAYLDDDMKWGWLRNKTKPEIESREFATVVDTGDIYSKGAYSYGALSSSGVRPEFTLVNANNSTVKLKLIVRNYLENETYYIDHTPKRDGTVDVKQIRKIAPYDELKWKNGTTYEFDTLREMLEFINTSICDIHFTKEYSSMFFDDYDWEEIDVDYHIDDVEDNLMILEISSHTEHGEY